MSVDTALTLPPPLVVMGVSGCGKSQLAAAVASRQGGQLIEGDALHDPADVEQMRQGIPLGENARVAWLGRVGAALAAAPPGSVAACSALRQRHREQLRAAVPGLRFAWLMIDSATARSRVAARAGAGGGHFFPSSLVTSQFGTLEPPHDEPGVLALDATAMPAMLLLEVTLWQARD